MIHRNVHTGQYEEHDQSGYAWSNRAYNPEADQFKQARDQLESQRQWQERADADQRQNAERQQKQMMAGYQDQLNRTGNQGTGPDWSILFFGGIAFGILLLVAAVLEFGAAIASIAGERPVLFYGVMAQVLVGALLYVFRDKLFPDWRARETVLKPVLITSIVVAAVGPLALGVYQLYHPSVPYLIKRLDNQLVFLNAPQELALKGEVAIEPLMTVLTSTNYTPRQKWRAFEALGLIGSKAKAAVPFMVECVTVKNKDEYATRAAVKALGGIGPDAASAVPEIIALLRYGENYHYETYVEAVRALGLIGPKAAPAVPLLASYVSDDWRWAAERPELVSASIQSLAEIGDSSKRALPALRSHFRMVKEELGWGRQQIGTFSLQTRSNEVAQAISRINAS